MTKSASRTPAAILALSCLVFLVTHNKYQTWGTYAWEIIVGGLGALTLAIASYIRSRSQLAKIDGNESSIAIIIWSSIVGALLSSSIFVTSNAVFDRGTATYFRGVVTNGDCRRLQCSLRVVGTWPNSGRTDSVSLWFYSLSDDADPQISDSMFVGIKPGLFHPWIASHSLRRGRALSSMVELRL